MIPERCTFCKGTLREGKTEFIARVGDEIVVVRDVPAFICGRRG
jgi:YgiT-type zinc finger domain-containing protein